MLAVASASRSELFPDVPTLAEAGYPGIDYDTWFGIMTSSDVPPEIVQKMNAAVNVALADPGLRGRYKDLGGEAMPMSSAAFKQVAVRETPVFSQLIKERDIKAD
jgi:tripartite-type tricarboxylate transporter receptor subunit TctC